MAQSSPDSLRERTYTYSLEGEFLRIGAKMILGLRQISDFVLMLNIDGDDYTYFSLQSKSAGINANALLKALSEK